MNKKPLKIAVFFLATISLFLIFGFALAARSLEVDYRGLDTQNLDDVDVPLFIKYIYGFFIAGAGITALWNLTQGGIILLTSAGNPEKIKAARDKIVAVFWGIILLLASYLILVNINPQLISLSLTNINLPQVSPTSYPDPDLPSSDLLRRIKDMADIVKTLPDKAKGNAEDIKSLTDKCDCDRTRSLCLCNGGEANASCEAKWCYAGPDAGNDPNLCGGQYPKGAHPCPDAVRIGALQKEIVGWRDIMLYYKTRALAEAKDLNLNVTLVLDKKIAFYNALISREKANEVASPATTNQLERELQKIEQEKQYKTQLIQKLKDLATALTKVEAPTTEIAKLPDQCFSDVGAKCQPSCLTGARYGCHDKLCGCQPDKCSGGNPCPVSEIQNQASQINSLPGEIMGICDQIINIIGQIK